MRELKRIAFLIEEFVLPSPAQQLLDRFLIGFPTQGEFRPSRVSVAVWADQSTADLLQRRKDDFGLIIAERPEDALRDADAVVVAGSAKALCPPESLARTAIDRAPVGTPIFISGLPAATYAVASELARLAAARNCPLLAGTAVPFAFRLPEAAPPARTRPKEGLIVVQGEFPAAELSGLEGLLSLLEGPQRRPWPSRRLRSLEGDALWRAGEDGAWSWPLFQAAISRSHTPQGNPVLDGRTEDIVGLGLAPKLARHPRGWILEHANGLRSVLLVLDGVVADIDLAVRYRNGEVFSAQLFRTPLPQQEEYSRLAAALLEFFSSQQPPWPLARGLEEVKVIAAMGMPEARHGAWVDVA
jgi:hypothetical protein